MKCRLNNIYETQLMICRIAVTLGVYQNSHLYIYINIWSNINDNIQALGGGWNNQQEQTHFLSLPTFLLSPYRGRACTFKSNKKAGTLNCILQRSCLFYIANSGKFRRRPNGSSPLLHHFLTYANWYVLFLSCIGTYRWFILINISSWSCAYCMQLLHATLCQGG